MGPIFGVMMVDYYLIRKGEVNVEALYREDGEFRFQSGWHVNAFIAAGIGIAVLVDPAQLHQLAASLVGRLRLVLRRRHRRGLLLHAAFGRPRQRAEGGPRLI